MQSWYLIAGEVELPGYQQLTYLLFSQYLARVQFLVGCCLPTQPHPVYGIAAMLVLRSTHLDHRSSAGWWNEHTYTIYQNTGQLT